MSPNVKDESGSDDNDYVPAEGTVICVKASTGNTGGITADGVTTLQEYLFNAGIIDGSGDQGRDVSYWVTYPPTTTTVPEEESTTTTEGEEETTTTTEGEEETTTTTVEEEETTTTTVIEEETTTTTEGVEETTTTTVGEEETTTTTVEDVTTTVPDETTTVPEETPPPGDSNRRLPITGFDTVSLLLFGLAALAAGGIILWVAKDK